MAKCTVELPARHQVIIPMRMKDKGCKCGLFELTKTPGGVLLSKTAVQGGKDGCFWVKAVNLAANSVTYLKTNGRVLFLKLRTCLSLFTSTPKKKHLQFPVSKHIIVKQQ